MELERPGNWIYDQHFLSRLKTSLRRRAVLQPGKWDLTRLDRIAWISVFEDRYTAPDGGYRKGADCYDCSGSRHVIESITVPTTIITSQDDPFIPYPMFLTPLLRGNPSIRLIAPRHGGLCEFFKLRQNREDQLAVKNRIVDVILGRC